MRGEIEKVIARNSVRLSRAYMNSVKREIEKYKKDPKVWAKHYKALKRLMKTRLFKKVKL